jgi:hypothetical protein
MAENPPR